MPGFPASVDRDRDIDLPIREFQDYRNLSRFFRLFGNPQGKYEGHENHSQTGANFLRL